MNDSGQFFLTPTPTPTPITIRVGDIIQYQIGGTITWTGIIIKTNKHNYQHMAEVQWLNDGHCGTVDVRDCSVIERA